MGKKPTKQEHIEQARHNERFLGHLISAFPDHYHDWKVTACFYAALHWVRLFLATKGVSAKSHQETLDCLNPKVIKKPAVHLPIPALYRPYIDLFALSQKARYDGFLQYGTFIREQGDNLADARQSLALVKKALFEQGIKEVVAKEGSSPETAAE